MLNFARALEGHAQKNAPELSAAVQELCTFHSVTLVFSGVFTKVEKLALSSYYAISAPRTATNPTATTTAAATACNPVDLLCLTSIALLQPQDSHIADLLAQQFTADNQAQLPSDKTEYIVRVKQAYAFAASQRKKRLADGTLTCVSLDFLAFICALCSKVLFLCYQDLQGSLEWGTYARSAADSPGNAVSPWLSGGASAFVAQSAVLEVLLVRADVYEVLGNVDSCLAYAREASALASNRLRSPPLQKVVLLHTMRLWHRTASSRLCGLLSELLEYTEQIYSSEEDRSDVMTRQVRQAAKCLNDIFLLAPDEVQQGDEAGGIIGDINYRHMHYYWDTAAVATEEGEPPANAYNCPMPPSERILIRAALNSPPAPPSPSPLFGGICSSLNAKNSCSEGFDEEACALRALLERASAVQGVDVVRALRRRYCLRLATAAPPASTPAAARKTPTAGDLQLNSQLMAFLAGASSCGVALERLAEIKNENISATDTDGTKNGGALSPSPTEPPLLFNFGCMTGAADCVNRAVLGDPHCVKLVLDKVRTMLQPSHHSSAGDPSHCVIAFACLESASGALILGRLDAGSSLVVSLPVHQQLQNLLNKWDDAQEISRAMLRQGVNAEQVAALTEKQKKQWWSSRQQHDAEVEAMLSDLQDLLGPWRVLLSTEPVRCELVDTCCAIFSKHGPTTSSCSHPGKDRSTVATALAQWAALLLSNTRHTSTPCDGTLISRIMPLTAVEVQAGLTALLRQSGFPEDRLQAAVQELTLCASAAAGDTEQLAATSPTSGHLAPAVDEPFFSAAAPDPHTSEAELNSLKVAELRSLLKDTGLDITGKKQDLVQRMLEHLRQQTLSQQNEGADASSGVAQAKMASSEDTTNADTGHLVLILDEQLQRFPFESMPALRRASCSRVPSFALLLKLMNSSTKIDQATVSLTTVCQISSIYSTINMHI